MKTKQLLLISLFLFSTVLTLAQVNISGDTTTTCSETFYDTGGSGGDYSSAEMLTHTFVPTNGSDKINVSFTVFDVEEGWDYLYVYNGPSTASPLIATLTGTDLPNDIASSAEGGELTFEFESDASFQQGGWEATISCVTPAEPDAPDTITFIPLSATSIVVQWPEPNTNGSPITSYTMEYKTGTDSAAVTGTNTQDTLTGLTASATYTYRVKATNSVGDSPYSDEFEKTIMDGDIGITAQGNDITSGAYTYEFGTILSDTSALGGVIIRNDGDLDITLDGTTAISVSGTDASSFIVEDSAGEVLGFGELLVAGILFDPVSAGTKTATVTIDSDDPDESSFTFTVTGTAVDRVNCEVPGGNMETVSSTVIPTSDDLFLGTINGLTDYIVPTGWSPAVALLFSFFGLEINIDTTADAYEGDYAIELESDGLGYGDLLTVVKCNGVYEQLTGYYKFTGAATDSVIIQASTGGQGGATETNTAIAYIDANASSYTQFVLDLLYDESSNDSIFITITPTANSTWNFKVDAIELTGLVETTVHYVDADATGGDDGSSWDDAYTDLQDALDAAAAGDQIWIAEGTYTPSNEYDFDSSSGSDAREAVFEIPDSVEVYGGFDGTETSVGQRSPEINVTVLSGDLNADDDGGGDNSENAYHVVFFGRADNTTILDGVTITGGHADGSSWNSNGGGIFIYNTGGLSSPILNEVNIVNNEAASGGGMYIYYNSFVDPDDDQLTVTNSSFEDNIAGSRGGAIYMDGRRPKSPEFENCIIRGNTAYEGGGIYTWGADSYTVEPSYSNTFIQGNASTALGGGIVDYTSSATLNPDYVNCVISGNSPNGVYTYASSSGTYMGEFVNTTITGNGNGTSLIGSGMYNYANSTTNYPILQNTIVYNNDITNSDRQIYNNGAIPTISYSNIEGSGGSGGSNWDTNYGNDVGNNIDERPYFLGPLDGIDAPSELGDFRLASISPSLDAGNDALNDEEDDIAGEDRSQNTAIDQGAYEGGFAYEDRLYVDHTASGSDDGSSWANAFTSLESALGRASLGDEVWVAQGTYFPTSHTTLTSNDGTSDPRKVAFEVRSGVKVYGGFDGSETSLEERDIVNNVTILSGDIDQNDDSGGDSTSNAYHVVYMYEPEDGTRLDGFTILAGNADLTGQSGFRTGGGLYVKSSDASHSPFVANSTFTENYGYEGGGLYFLEGTPVVLNSSFIGNAAYNGGGVVNDNAEAVYISTSFKENLANNNGGAIYNEDCDPEFINATIQGNEGDEGGAIYNYYSNAAFYNTLISGNYAGDLGGAVRNWGTFGDPQSPEFINTTITGNFAVNTGGGIISTQATPIITNSIIWGNDAPSAPQYGSFNPGVDPVVSYSIIETAGSIYGDNGNNSTGDPLFTTSVDPANAPTTGGDFTSTGFPPSLNAGNDDAIPEDTYDLDDDDDSTEPLPYDLAGNARQDLVVDIGAFERLTPPTITHIYRSSPEDEATNADAVTFEVWFSEPVLNVTLDDFVVGGVASGTLDDITMISATVYEIDVTGISGDGTLELDIAGGQDIEDSIGLAYDGDISLEQIYVIDNTDPAAPSTPDLISEDDSGTADDDDLTNVFSPTLSGTSERLADITLEANGEVDLGSTTADVNGDWSITLDALADGEYDITATATDTVGNEGAASGTLTLVIDTEGPEYESGTIEVTDSTFGPVTFEIVMSGATEEEVELGDIALFSETVTGTKSIESVTTSALEIMIDDLSGIGTFSLIISENVFLDDAGNGNMEIETSSFTNKPADPELSFAFIGDKTYGDPSFTLVVESESEGEVGFTSSDPEIVSIDGDEATILGAGSVTLTATQDEEGMYAAADAEVELDIAKAELEVVADDQTRSYGSDNPNLTISYEGLVGEDTSEDLDTEPMATTSTDAASPVDTYTIDVSGGSDDNYDFVSYTSGSLEVTKATLTVTAEDASKFYGEDNPMLSFVYDGFVLEEDEADLTSEPLISTSATNTSDAGEYDIVLTGGTDESYELVLVDGTLTINQGMLTFDAQDAGKTYGEENPELTYTIFGFVNGDDESDIAVLPTATTVVTTESSVGEYVIDLEGGEDENYFFIFNTATLTIDKADLTVSAVDAARAYGEENPTFELSFEGFVNDDDDEDIDELPLVTTLTGPDTDVGVYDLTVSGGSDDNYSFTYEVGELTIEKADQVITFEPASIIGMDQGTYELEATSTSELSVSFTSSDENLATISGTTLTPVATGNVSITATQDGNDNYNAATPVVQEITITEEAPEEQTITFNALDDRTFGDDPFELEATASSGLELTYISSDTEVATIDGSTVTLVGAGTTTITASQGGDDTYAAADDVEQTLTVDKASQTLAFSEPESAVFGSATLELTATASSGLEVTYGFSSDDMSDYEYDAVSGEVTANGAGTLLITASQEGNANYEAAADVSVSWLVEKADQSITFEELDAKEVGDAAYDPGAVASSGLTVTYVSSDSDVATISNNQIVIIGEGEAEITASQSGNEDYNGAESVVRTLTVTDPSKSSQTITFDALENQTFGDPDFELDAEASSGLDVTYTSSNTGVVSISGSTVTIVGAGSATITAVQSGNDEFSPAEDVSQELVIHKADQEITTDAPDEVNLFFESNIRNIGFSSTSGLTPILTLVGGPATIIGNTLTFTGTGTVELSFSQEGNDNYNAAPTVTHFIEVIDVQKEEQLIGIAGYTGKVYGDEPFELDVSSNSDLPIIITSSDETVATIDGTTVTIVSAGNTTITVSQPGNDEYLDAIPISVNMFIDRGRQTIDFVTADSVNTAEPQTLTLTATSSTGLPVTFSILNSSSYSLAGDQLTISGVGFFDVTATQEGNDFYYPVSVTRTIVGYQRFAQTIAFNTVAELTYGDEPVELVSTTESGLAVTYTSSNSEVISIDGNIATIVGAGTAVITATQAGNDFWDSIEASQEVVVNKVSQEVQFELVSSVSLSSGTLTLSATASSGLGLRFESSDENVVSVSGDVATLLQVGTVTLTAIQDGDNNHLPAETARELTVTEALGLQLSETRIYPIPALDHLMVELDQAEQVEIRITDLSGRTLRKTVVHQRTTRVTLDELKVGVYMLMIISGDQTISQRFTKIQ